MTGRKQSDITLNFSSEKSALRSVRSTLISCCEAIAAIRRLQTVAVCAGLQFTFFRNVTVAGRRGLGRFDVASSLSTSRFVVEPRQHGQRLECVVSVTGSVTGSATDSATGSVTDSVTDKVTDNVTDSVTDRVTDSVTDSVTDNVTDIITDRVRDSHGQRFECVVSVNGTNNTPGVGAAARLHVVCKDPLRCRFIRHYTCSACPQ